MPNHNAATAPSESTATGTHTTRHRYRGYLIVAVILTVITAVEIMIPSVESIRTALTRTGSVAALLTLSVVKGAGVLLYYMHLRHDNRLFSVLFLAPLVIASAIVIILFVFFVAAAG